METELTLSRGGFPPLSARGCTQELIPISSGNFRRTINNKLIYMGNRDKKYRSIITCQDKGALATDGVYVGCLVDVGCIQRLWQRITMPIIILERKAIPGSIMALDADQNPLDFQQIDEQRMKILCFDDRQDQHGYIGYRPLLHMQVIRYALHTDEWGVKGGWTLELEEI